ncbi:MAG: galactokinase [Bacteroidetes bacterium]|nr:galactokinase [Bacteroidota bacterium]
MSFATLQTGYMNLEKLRQQFIDLYGNDDQLVRIYFAPGRVNLIGDHIDYNGGKVLPFAIGLGTYLAIAPNKNSLVRLYSDAKDGAAVVYDPSVDELITNDSWTDYVLGIISGFRKEKIEVAGFDLFYSSDLPIGSGLSSSASLEMVTAFAINEELGGYFNIKELIKISHEAENFFVGVQCGLMDQTIIGLAKEGSLLFYDLAAGKVEYISRNNGSPSFVVVDSKKNRTLASSEYNERRNECEQLLGIMKDDLGIINLCQLRRSRLKDYSSIIGDDVLVNRLDHILSENQRVEEVIISISNDDWADVGRLMKESHLSLKNNYEVSCHELDYLVELSNRSEHSLGARMTGAGMGGCIIALVNSDEVKAYIDDVSDGYMEKTGLQADFIIAEPSAGVELVDPIPEMQK